MSLFTGLYIDVTVNVDYFCYLLVSMTSVTRIKLNSCHSYVTAKKKEVFYSRVCMTMHVCVCVCVYVCMYVSVYVYVCMYVCVCMCVCVCVQALCVRVCVHVYACGW